MTLRSGIRNSFGALLASAFVLGSVAVAEARTGVYVQIGPPAPLVEVRPVAPAAGYVWVPGYYGWNQRAYHWTPGHWARPPHRHGTWVEPRWVHERHGWHMTKGYWR